MSRHESTLGRATYQFGNQADVDRFVAALESFERGDLDAEAWRKFRLENGTYGQRQEGDLSMLRAKIPQGVLYSDQARAIASVTDTYSRGFCHITTRQNVQFHFVKFANVEAAMRDLAAAGLTCREACGNSVRAITAPPTAGVARDEAFDVTPYANALTHHLLRHKLASGLPRKFKIAFSGGGRDHAFALVNDIGFRAELVDARRVFRVSVGGGTATLCASGTTLVDALEPRDIFVLAEGILRVFDAHGDREHRHKARMKYLVKRIGWDAFRAQVIEQYELARAEREARDGDRPSVRGPTLLSLVEEEEARARARSSRLPDIAALRALAHQSAPRLLVGHDRAARWRATNVQPQKQDGFVVATVVLPLGDVTSGQLRALAEIADAFSDGEMRTTHGQNIVLRWVRVDDVGALHERLAAIDLAATDPDSAADVTSCPGAESCKLAVTQSRGAATRIGERFAERLALLDEAGPLDVRVSGCPNGCGLHHVAGIGLQGGVRKVGGRAVPQYFVMLGGDAGGDRARFGRVVAKIPARRIADALERLVADYVARRGEGERAVDYFARVEPKYAKALLADLETLDEATLSEDDFVDSGGEIAGPEQGAAA